MSVKDLGQKILGLYGFGDSSANIYVWVITILVIGMGSAYAYSSYDRHKLRKQVYRLKVDNLRLQTEKDVQASEHRIKLHQLEMKHINKKKPEHEKKRKKLREMIQANQKKVKDSRKKLAKSIDDLKDKDVDALLKQNISLTKETDK